MDFCTIRKLVSTGLLILTISGLSSCCVGYSVRVHNLSGQKLYLAEENCEVKEIPNLGYAKVGISPMILDHRPKNLQAPVSLIDKGGQRLFYPRFPFSDYRGTTRTTRIGKQWPCAETTYRAVIRPDLSIDFGGTKLFPNLNSEETTPRKSQPHPNQGPQEDPLP